MKQNKRFKQQKSYKGWSIGYEDYRKRNWVSDLMSEKQTPSAFPGNSIMQEVNVLLSSRAADGAKLIGLQFSFAVFYLFLLCNSWKKVKGRVNTAGCKSLYTLRIQQRQKVIYTIQIFRGLDFTDVTSL